jgi:hypothetical protein
MLLHRSLLQKRLYLWRKFYMSPEKKVQGIYRLFCFLLWENAGFAGPFGINQTIHDLP